MLIRVRTLAISAIELVSDPAYTDASFLINRGHSGYASHAGAGSVRTRSHLLGANRLEAESPGGDREPIEITAPVSPAMLWSRWGLRIDKGCGRHKRILNFNTHILSPLLFSFLRVVTTRKWTTVSLFAICIPIQAASKPPPSVLILRTFLPYPHTASKHKRPANRQ